MPYIETVPVKEAQGRLRQQYETSLERDHRVAGIIQVMSQTPEALEDLLRLYMRVAHGPSRLTRIQREMIAVVVSKVNGCRY